MLATVPGAAPVVPAAAQAVVPPAGWDGAEGAAPAIKDGVLQPPADLKGVQTAVPPARARSPALPTQSRAPCPPHQPRARRA